MLYVAYSELLPGFDPSCVVVWGALNIFEIMFPLL